MMAKLPEILLRQHRPELREIGIGETVFTSPIAMRVTADLSCFLWPTMRGQLEKDDVNFLRVRHDASGFHVTVIGRWKWEADAPVNEVKDWIPVASIVVDDGSV
jgi:hypothetical protein